MYIISDRNEIFIKRDGTDRYATTKLEDAEVFNTYQKADNVRISLTKAVRAGHNWQVFTLDNSEEVNSQYVEVNVEDLQSKINDVAELLATMRGNSLYLNDMLSNVDKEITDILHYIENYSFSACEGYKLAKALKEARERRRNIKNQMEIIKYINESTGSSIAKGYLSKNLEDMKHREYTPRVLTELFENKK